MSPFNRQRRAAAKQRAGRGRHARPAPGAILPASAWPQVSPELAEREYEFPHVELPASRPMVGRQVLAELAADDDTQVLEQVVIDELPQPHAGQLLAEMGRAQIRRDFPPVLDGKVVDERPKPAQAEGLIPVPSVLFLNAGAVEPGPEPAPVRPYVTVGNALPAQLTAWELDLLHRPVREILGDPDDMPTQSLPAVREPERLPRPPQRDEQHPLVFSVFDALFWREINETMRDAETAAAEREAANDRRAQALTGRLTALERGHWEHIARVAPVEYAERLANSADIARAARPPLQLPRRTPGAAAAAIEACAGELVDA